MSDLGREGLEAKYEGTLRGRDGVMVAVFNVDGEFHAISDRAPGLYRPEDYVPDVVAFLRTLCDACSML